MDTSDLERRVLRLVAEPARARKKDGKVFKLEVTSIDKGSVPDSAFAPPAGWRKFDLGAMMGGLGGFPGARPPAGGSN